MLRHLVVVSLALGLAACFPRTGPAPGQLSAATVAAATQRWSDASEASLEQGRQHFLNACANCHGYPALDAVPDEKWPSVALRMADKADLTPAEGDLILRFIVAAGHGVAAPATAAQ